MAFQLLERRGGRLIFVELDRPAQIEPLLDLLRVYAVKVAIEDLAHGRADQIAHHGIGARISPSYSSSSLPVIPGMAA